MSTQQAIVPAGVWELDPVHSQASFAVKHMVVSTFRAAFEDVEATVTSDGAGGLALKGEVRADSIDIRDENLRAQVVSSEFLDVENHPTITFESVSVEASGPDLTVEGDLTIKGITKRVRATGTATEPILHFSGGHRIGISLSTELDRRDFEMNWTASLPEGGLALANEVVLSVQLELATAE